MVSTGEPVASGEGSGNEMPGNRGQINESPPFCPIGSTLLSSSPTPTPLGHIPRKVATSILAHEGRVLLMLRSSKVGTFQGRWAGCSGFVEEGETPRQASVREISEETGLDKGRLELVATIEPLLVDKSHGAWLIHSFLYATDTTDITLDWEHDDHIWVKPEKVREYDRVPGLGRVIDELFLACSDEKFLSPQKT